MYKKFGVSLAVAGVIVLAAPMQAHAAAHGPAPVKKAVVDGKVQLVSPRARTLYTFDKDSKGTSACYKKCAINWPPLRAKSGGKKMMGGDLTTIKRKDGTYQWAYRGKPLYTWKKDKKAGDTTGDGVKGVWHVARPR